MTKTKKHHWLFKLWVKIRGLLALTVVLAGVCVGLLSLLLPFESLYQKQLEQFLEEQWNLEVNIDQIDGSWNGYGPYFQLKNLTLSGKQNIELEAASLSINVYQYLLPGGRTGIDLSINNAELGMIQSADGASITINNQQDEAKFTDMLDRVLTTGSLRVDELVLNIANQEGKVLLAGLKADFLLEQDKTQRAFKLLINSAKDNQNIEVRSLSQRSQSLTRNAQWYIKFHQFEVNQLNELVTDIQFPNGYLDGQLWVTAENGYVSHALGDLNWSNPEQGMSFQLKVKHQGDDKHWLSHWQLDDLSVNGVNHDDFEINVQRNGTISQIKSGGLPIDLMTQFLLEIKPQNAYYQSLLDQLRGDLSNIELSFDHAAAELQSGFVAFEGLAVKHESFDLAGLSGEVKLTTNQANILLDTGSGHLSAPALYRDTLNWQQLSAQLDVDFASSDRQVRLNNFWCDCEDFDLQLWMHLDLTAVNSVILNSRLNDVDVSMLWKYWPHNVWKEKTLNWLDNSLLKGLVETGFVFVNGDMIPQAFKSGAAAFVSRAYVRNTSNQFRPDWPVVSDLNATALFTHDEVHVSVNQAKTQGIEIAKSQVDIDSLDVGILSVEMTAKAKNNQLLDYLNQSPLSNNIKLSDAITLSGDQQIALNFDISLKSDKKTDFNPQGQINFNQGTFETEHFSLDHINGPVQLDGYDLLIDDLAAELQSAPVKLNGKIATKTATGLSIDVNIAGFLNAEYLLNKVNQILPIEGESFWNIWIKNQQDQLFMTAQSDLSGVSSLLPAPLDKSEGEQKTFSIKCNIPCQESQVEINYNNQIESIINTTEGDYHLTQLKFIDPNAESPSEAPFGGYIKVLDLDQWLALMAENKTANESQNLPFSEVRVSIEKLLFMSREFTEIDLHIVRQASSYEINVDSQAIKGLVTIADDIGRKGIVAQFDHLNWIDSVQNDNTHSPTSTKSAVPDIHLWAENFSYAGIPLGALRMEMRNVADGIKVEQMSIKSELAEINISGAWNKASGPMGQSNFNVVMFSEKIADFLSNVGFNAPITNAQTLIEMNAIWTGVPSEFDMANIDGELDIKIGQGQVLDQQPGFGRVLGLFNLTNLPRRLLLDFRDVLAEGLLFRSMEGHFVITDGVANTQDFLIKASSAKIHIQGDVGFAEQSYNQTITVRPQIGKTFPTIGAIAGGPVGAAAGFLVQGLFDKQLKNKNEIIYHVTGTWDDPQIELISDE
ncbi:YhdP family protein [Marinicella litoralis]|uniref:Uncharacterized protein (TIGR02099 family) n=1 Tax=Marinicella litoralis TaxID=644220 RepID=A0A4R6XIL7_9GAMM|nr:AsmA-like C-terminal region-containing protein [Marinicella litoralis]TDR19325.1 uncharacterized protein (TIGR02099 family) [Marinicella litoralis]